MWSAKVSSLSRVTPYVAARVGFEPRTLWLKGIDSGMVVGERTVSHRSLSPWTLSPLTKFPGQFPPWFRVGHFPRINSPYNNHLGLFVWIIEGSMSLPHLALAVSLKLFVLNIVFIHLYSAHLLV